MSNPHILVCYDDDGSPVRVSFHDDCPDAERCGNVSDLQFRVFAPVISKMDDPQPNQPPSYNEVMRELDQLDSPYEPEPYTDEQNDALIIYRCLRRGVPIEHIATVLHEYEQELVRCGASDPESPSTPEQWRSFVEMVAVNPGLFGIDPDQMTDDDDAADRSPTPDDDDYPTQVYRVSNIEWDTDARTARTLPRTVYVSAPIHLHGDELGDYLSDKLSDLVGFTHHRFTYGQLDLDDILTRLNSYARKTDQTRPIDR